MNFNNVTYSNEILVSGSFEQLDTIRNFVDKNATGFGFDNKQTNQLVLAVDETCTNLIKYSFNNQKDNYIKISISHETNNFIIKVLDNAEPFDLTQKHKINMNTYLKKMQSGGLGIHLIKLIIDEIQYIPKNGSSDENMLILKKRI